MQQVIEPICRNTVVNACHSGRQENKISDQQVKGVGAGTNRIDSEQDHNKG